MVDFTKLGNNASSLSFYKYTLDDLEKDEEFQKISERFLTSVGEKSDDIFEYLRDSDYNLYSGMQRAMESGKFNEQQKSDYRYLRDKFDNADMGSFKQYAELAKDAVIDIATDPTAIAATLLTPVTGGTSLASRAVLGKAATEGIKNIRKSAAKSVAFTGAEVGAWTGLDNHFRQNTELNTDIRKLYSNSELAGSAAIGAVTGGLVGGFFRRNELFEDRLKRLYSDDGFRKDLVDGGKWAKTSYKLRRAKDKLFAKTIASPAWVLKTDADYSKTARELGERLNIEFAKDLTTKTKRRVGYTYSEDVEFRQSNYMLRFDNSLEPLRRTGQVLPEDEDRVISILRTGKTKRTDSAEIKETAKNLRQFYDDIYKDAYEAGVIDEQAYKAYIEDPTEFYFPRSWNREAIAENREEFKKLLIKKRKQKDGSKGPIVPEAKVDEVIDGMLNKQNEMFSSHSNLLTYARIFKELPDEEFKDFLTNDLVPVTTNYFMNAARVIETKNHFLLKRSVSRPKVQKFEKELEDGTVKETERFTFYKESNEDQFIERFINPINKELKENTGRNLTAKEQKEILEVFKSVTGQVDYFDSGLIQGIYDGTKLANAVAYLPLATISSLSEAFIPLAKAPITSYVKGMQDSITKGHKFLTDELGQLFKEKYKLSDDELIREMNSVWLGVNEAFTDVTNRLAGEGLQNETLKKLARGYYRFNLLIPWTKTVQLAAFSTGKDLIRQNLLMLTKAKQLKLSSAKIEKLEGELLDLGIDITKGKNWVLKNNGGYSKKAMEDSFYTDNFLRGAGRFTNGVILQTSRQQATVPRFMTNPKFDILTQFLRYPTAFGNTVLRNFARDAITDPTISAPKIAAFVAMATNIAKATNYWRTSPEERERIEEDGRDWRDTLKAYQRVGLLGPLEYGLRVAEGMSYGQNPLVATAGVGGPVINDIIGLTLYNRGLFETAARKAPLVGTKNLFDRAVGDIMEEYTGFRDPYTPLQKAGKAADKTALSGFRSFANILTGREERETTDRLKPSTRLQKAEGGSINVLIDPYTGQPVDYRAPFVTGGLVEGAEKVPFTKEDPADRINKFTGEPYQEEMDRLGFKDAGKVERTKITPIEKTGETSRVGRPIWKGKLGDKEIFYSERTVTFPLNKEGTQWVTFPNINEQGLEIGEDRLRQYVLDKGPVDPITGEEFPVFNTEKEASLYASERSPSLRVQKNQGGVLDLLRLKRGNEVADALVNYGEKVAEIESNNIPNRVQLIKRDGQFVEDGPGRGKYQFEMFYAGGSGSAKNAVQRVLNLYERYGQKAPEKLVELSLEEDVDVSKLPESLQDDIFYANAAEHPNFKLDDLASGKLSEKDAWLDYHWAGKEEDRKSKSDLWDERFVKEVVDNLQN